MNQVASTLQKYCANICPWGTDTPIWVSVHNISILGSSPHPFTAKSSRSLQKRKQPKSLWKVWDVLIAAHPSQEAGISQLDLPASSALAKESEASSSLARETQSSPTAALTIILFQGSTEKYSPHASTALFVCNQRSDLGSYYSISFLRKFLSFSPFLSSVSQLRAL